MVQCTLLISSLLQQQSSTLKATQRIMSISQNKTMNILLFLPCYLYLSFDKPLRIKEGNIMFQTLRRGPATMRSVYKSDNKYRHPNGLRQQIFLKIFSSCIHTSIRLTEIMSFLNPLLYS